jgi:hypothetical protein
MSIIGHPFKNIKQKLAHSLGLPFQEVLPETVIQEAILAEKITYRKRLFWPVITVWMFLSQVLDKDKSCENAVSRFIAFLSSQKAPPPSSDPSAYCQARQRLPEGLFKRLFVGVAHRLQARVSQEGLWKGRRVFLLDGSTLSMPDTPENQAAYPQHKTQAPGCGFPLARIVGLFSLATGAAWDLLIGAWKTPEIKMARQLYPQLSPQDVVVGDRIFGSYADFFMLQTQAIDGLFRMHQRRKTDFRKGERLGKNDHLATWTKPKHCPQGLPQEIYDQLPETLTIREIRYALQRKGYRTKSVTLATTLLDPKAYPKDDLTELFGQRWSVELDLRHLKTTMGMDVLSTQTPQMVRKEIFCHLLAYNLIRSLMWDAAVRYKVSALRLSIQATIRHTLNFAPQLAQAGRLKRRVLYGDLLDLIAKEQVPDRSGRSEPRVRKRRPKAYPVMNKPRQELRRKLAA